jgi:hypothetical protein
MSDWTFGESPERGDHRAVDLEGCHNFFAFNLDQLIKGAGADYKLEDIPPDCGVGQLAIRLSFANTPPEGEG